VVLRSTLSPRTMPWRSSACSCSVVMLSRALAA